jgi:hypothetical protein
MMDIKNWMIEDISKDLVTSLMNDYHLDLKEALDVLYNSDTYASLNRFENGLYSQSSVYIYDCLKSELTTGKIG